MKTQEITPRQLEAIVGGLRGNNQRQVATDMVVEKNTVKKHLCNARRQLGETNRIDLFLECVDRKLIDEDTLRSLVTPDEILRINSLSPREREVTNLLLIPDTNSNKAIADTLIISIETVKRHFINIFEKLGTPNRLRVAVIMYVGTRLSPNPTVRR